MPPTVLAAQPASRYSYINDHNFPRFQNLKNPATLPSAYCRDLTSLCLRVCTLASQTESSKLSLVSRAPHFDVTQYRSALVRLYAGGGGGGQRSRAVESRVYEGWGVDFPQKWGMFSPDT